MVFENFPVNVYFSNFHIKHNKLTNKSKICFVYVKKNFNILINIFYMPCYGAIMQESTGWG